MEAPIVNQFTEQTIYEERLRDSSPLQGFRFCPLRSLRLCGFADSWLLPHRSERTLNKYHRKDI